MTSFFCCCFGERKSFNPMVKMLRCRCLFFISFYSFIFLSSKLRIAHSPWNKSNAVYLFPASFFSVVVSTKKKMKKIWFTFSVYNTFWLYRSIFSGRKEAKLYFCRSGTMQRRLSMSKRLSIDFQAKSHLFLFSLFVAILHLISILFRLFFLLYSLASGATNVIDARHRDSTILCYPLISKIYIHKPLTTYAYVQNALEIDISPKTLYFAIVYRSLTIIITENHARIHRERMRENDEREKNGRKKSRTHTHTTHWSGKWFVSRTL